ncbi:cytochrome c [Geomonas silvestris]|uniref:Cytochrome c n=1 Tax=Geomonas silvestris TaxID=2740184 RepID=A0A6V8MI55_9BACT|nr:cytochrome C [Geomonas silvestris]GFO59638.1 cytochrome c [Geomonas silvestris]
MKISKKDWLFIGVIVIVLAVFYAISGEEKTKRVPVDEKHQAAYELFKKTQSKMEVDKTCPSCHFEPGGVPFPAKHPVKPKDGPMRCLFCHKLKASAAGK